MKRIDKDKIGKILVIRTDRMGEVLLNIPAVRALKQSFHSSIFALVAPAVKELVECIPEIEQTLVFDEKQWNRSVWMRLNLLREIRKNRFDLAVILNPNKRLHLLTYLAAIPRRLGYDRKWGFLLTHKIEDRKSSGAKHEVEYNLDLVRAVGADTNDLDISLKVGEKDRQFVEDLLKKYEIKEKDTIIAIHPYSSNPAKCWPKENFACLADELAFRFSAKVIVIGGETETTASHALLALAKRPLVNLTGKLTLRQLSALFKMCALLISNDSGPVHIAAACRTPCVVFFGRNIAGVAPKRWRPWGNGHTILHKDPGCNPCLDRDCPHGFKCLKAITLDEVLKAVEKYLRE